MMHTLKNLGRRPVSFRGNSGQTWHVPPGVSVEVPDFEVKDNDALRKLADRHLIGTATAERKAREPASEDKGRGRRSRPEQ